MNKQEEHITAKLKRELVLKINPEEMYPVRSTIKQDRTKVMIPTYLKGKDLTENQIINLWKEKII
jgi:hypothetical protein